MGARMWLFHYTNCQLKLNIYTLPGRVFWWLGILDCSWHVINMQLPISRVIIARKYQCYFYSLVIVTIKWNLNLICLEEVFNDVKSRLCSIMNTYVVQYWKLTTSLPPERAQTIFLFRRMCGPWSRILPVRLICSAQLRSSLTFAQWGAHIPLWLWGIISQQSTANKLPSCFISAWLRLRRFRLPKQ